MANKFPITRGMGTLLGQGPSVKGEIDFNTGEDYLAQAIAKFGATFSAIGKAEFAKQATQELTDAELQTRLDHQKFAIDLDGNTDPHTYQALFDDWLGTVKSREIKNKAAAEAYAVWIKKMEPAWQEGLSAAKKATNDSNFMASLFAAGQYAVQTGQIGAYLNMVTKGVDSGIIDKYEAARWVNETEVAIQKAAEEAAQTKDIQALRTEASEKATEDEALDFIDSTGLERGMPKEDINFVRSLVSADWAREQAKIVEAEETRVEEVDLELSKQMYAEENKTTGDDVYAAKLPQALRDKRLGEVIARDKAIAKGEDIVTSNFTQGRINVIRSAVTEGEITLAEGLSQYTALSLDVARDEQRGNIDDLFKAAKDAEDDTKRQNAGILSEREKTLRDAIEADPSIYIQPEDRDFLRDLANQAVNELNDKFRSLEFKTAAEVDAIVDMLKRKYSLAPRQLAIAQSVQQVERAETFKQQVEKTKRLVDALRRHGKTAEAQLLLDDAIKLGLANKDGTPTTGKETKDKPPITTKSLFERLQELGR